MLFRENFNYEKGAKPVDASAHTMPRGSKIRPCNSMQIHPIPTLNPNQCHYYCHTYIGYEFHANVDNSMMMRRCIIYGVRVPKDLRFVGWFSDAYRIYMIKYKYIFKTSDMTTVVGAGKQSAFVYRRWGFCTIGVSDDDGV